MSAGKPICQRCHRLKTTNSAGYCGACAEVLRAQERPRAPLDPATAAVLTPSLAPPTDPSEKPIVVTITGAPATPEQECPVTEKDGRLTIHVTEPYKGPATIGVGHARPVFEEAPPEALPVQAELPAGQPPAALFVMPTIDEDETRL